MSKYGFFSGPYLDTFYTVIILVDRGKGNKNVLPMNYVWYDHETFCILCLNHYVHIYMSMYLFAIIEITKTYNTI